MANIVQNSGRLVPGAAAAQFDLDDGSVATIPVAVLADNSGNIIQLANSTDVLPATIGDGQLVTLGYRADPVQTDPTQAASLMSLMKGFIALLRQTLSANIQNWPANQNVSVTNAPNVSVQNFPASQRATSQDGDQATIGSTGDAAGANTLVGLLKSIKAEVVGTLSVAIQNWPASQSVAVSNLPATQRVTSQDGDQATIGSTGDASTQTSLVGLLKAIRNAVQATLAVSVQNWPASQSVAVSNFPASQTVAVANLPATQPTSTADGQSVTIGAKTDAAWVSGSGSVIALLKTAAAALAGTLLATISNLPSAAADSASAATMAELVPGLYNGATVDRWRNNRLGFTLIASGARSTLAGSAVQANYNWRGVYISLNISSVPPSGALGLRLAVVNVDIQSGAQEYIWLADASNLPNAVGNYLYLLHPDVDPAVMHPFATPIAPLYLVEQKKLPLPGNWGIQVIPQDAGSYTYALYANPVM